jgi:ubiquinol oxidase
MAAPQTAIDYYHLDPNATMRDVILSIRADESTHRETNHFLSEVEQTYEMEEEAIYK